MAAFDLAAALPIDVEVGDSLQTRSASIEIKGEIEAIGEAGCAKLKRQGTLLKAEPSTAA
ncbi:MAG: hypothetical protein R2748_13000 [Bryobacterales bacterium]